MVVFESAFLYDRLLPEVYTLDEFWRAVVATWLLVLASIVAIRWITDALGVTPGRLLLGIRIVDAATGRPPGWRAGLVRSVVAVISRLALGLGYLWAAWDGKGQTWHDNAAGTIAIRSRIGRSFRVEAKREQSVT